MGNPKYASLQWWARELYGKVYIDLTDEEAIKVFEAQEEEYNGAKRKPKPEPSNSSSPSQSLP
jgi:hypothetical protein